MRYVDNDIKKLFEGRASMESEVMKRADVEEMKKTYA